MRSEGGLFALFFCIRLDLKWQIFYNLIEAELKKRERNAVCGLRRVLFSAKRRRADKSARQIKRQLCHFISRERAAPFPKK